MKIFHNRYLAGLGTWAGLAGLIFSPAPTRAANVYWTGPAYTYTHYAYDSSADMLTTNHVGADSFNNVWLTRAANYPLYNAAAETSWNGGISPANTLWAVASGPLTNADSLTYDTFSVVVGHPGDSPGSRVGVTFYVKIVSDNIYLSLQLTAWGNNDGGSFSYIRSTPMPANVPPTVAITSPTNGASFTAPAIVPITASASDSDGSVTNVAFFDGGTFLGGTNNTPYTVTATLATGATRSPRSPRTTPDSPPHPPS